MTEQLELFDLRPYTSSQLADKGNEVLQIVRVRSQIEYEQLELDLFPQQSEKALTEFTKLAA
jgi:hypothetical protein